MGYKPPAPEIHLSGISAGLAAQPRPALLTVAPRPVMNSHSTRTTKWEPISGSVLDEARRLGMTDGEVKVL